MKKYLFIDQTGAYVEVLKESLLGKRRAFRSSKVALKH